MEEPSRRRMLGLLAGAVLAPTEIAAQQKSTPETGSAVKIERAALSKDAAERAIKETVTSLKDGMTHFQGRTLDPRESGFKYHDELLDHYAEGLGLDPNTPKQEIIRHVEHSLEKRIQILPVSDLDAKILSSNADHVQKLANAMKDGEVGAFIYMSTDRKYQRVYGVRKSSGKLTFLEAYTDSTSRGIPGVRTDASITPLGLFKIPRDGVVVALPGQVTKVEKPEITRYYFTPVSINGQTKYFVKNYNKSGKDEIITVTGDTHLLWSPEIDGKGIKIHDTTELDKVGQAVSSGCIRTPAVRRFTLLTKDNKFPTQVYIRWDKSEDQYIPGYGGVFGGEKIEGPRKN